MSLALLPSTPKAQTAPSPLVTPSPGTWRHPQFDEIAQRQNVMTFDQARISKLIWNFGALMLAGYTYYGMNPSGNIYDFLVSIFGQSSAQSIASPSQYTIFTFVLVIIYNLTSNLGPYLWSKYWKQDYLSDIPLTPSQRSLLGLDPNIKGPSTPGTQYITPPRYPRSVTPRGSVSGTPTSNRSASYSGSRLLRQDSRPSPSFRGERPSSADNTPFSTPTAGQRWQKKIWEPRDTSRRHSFGTPSLLGQSIAGGVNGIKRLDVSLLGDPSTPSPPPGRGASVGLNNKWLYERGREGSFGRSVYS
ncbi:MAG: hypothetical protein MMC33_002421 [Icmadophila ericetorum]|nr:hypothetical protein [Icmadophila ericetorum]